MVKRIIGMVGLYNNGQVIQTAQFKPKNFVHACASHAVKKFCNEGIDEILILDLTKNGIETDKIENTLKLIVEKCFIPVIFGGNLKNISFIDRLFKLGVDRVLINTQIFSNDEIIDQIIFKYGSQALVAGIDCDQFCLNSFCSNKLEEKNHIMVSDHIDYLSSKGVTEILFNSPNNDGLRKGYAINSGTLGLLEKLDKKSMSTIFMGGAWDTEHFLKAAELGISGLAAANCFHYKEAFPFVIKKYLSENNFEILY